MAASTLPPPPLDTPVAQDNGKVSQPWARWLGLVQAALGAVTESAPVYLNAWSNLAGKDTAKFFKDPFGVVHVSAWMTGGAVGSPAFKLPAGYAPAGLKAFASYSWNGAAQVSAVATVDASGNVTPALGANAEFAVNFSFRSA